MSKRRYLLRVSFIFVSVLVGLCCVYYSHFGYTAPVLSIILEDAVFKENMSALSNEYPVSAKTANTEYFFSNDNYDDNTALVHNTEIMLHAASEYYDVKKNTLRIFFTQDTDNTSIKTTYSQLVMSTGYVENPGNLFNYITNGRLPAWLCTGLEFYWLERYGVKDIPVDRNTNARNWSRDARAKGLPEYGDEWFIPGFINDTLSQKHLSIAYLFVKYLDETDLLTGIVRAYLNEDDLWEAEKLRSEAWRAFIGDDAIPLSKTVFQYLYDPYRTSNSNWVFCVHTEQGDYYFTQGEWTRQIVYDRIALLDDGIMFVKDWLDYTYEKPVKVILETYVNPLVRGITYGNIEIYLYDSLNMIPMSLVHEAVHYFTNAIGLRTNFPYPRISIPTDGSPPKVRDNQNLFDEGLCNAVRYLYKNTNRIQEIDNIRMEDYRRMENGYYRNYKWLPDYYRARTGYEYTDEPFDHLADADITAYVMIDSIKNNRKTDEQSRYGIIENYDTTPSFILYLLSKKPKEDFMRAYQNINLMEEIYGKDMEGMITEWLEYLNSFVK